MSAPEHIRENALLRVYDAALSLADTNNRDYGRALVNAARDAVRDGHATPAQVARTIGEAFRGPLEQLR